MRFSFGWYVLPFCVPLLLDSSITPKELEYRDFRNFTVNKVGFFASTIRMDLVYYNPNNFSLQLRATDVDIFLENNYLGHTIQEMQLTIPSRAEFSIPISMDVDMKNLLKNGLLTLVKSEVSVKVMGSVKVGKANIFKSFPVNYEGKQQFTMF